MFNNGNYKLGDLGNLKGGISNLNKKKYDEGICFVNYMDIFRNEYINENTKLKLYNANQAEYKQYNLEYGDALFTASSVKKMTTCMSSVFLSNKKAIFNGFSKRYRFNQKILLPKYAGLLFRTNNFRNQAISLTTGYARYNISQKDILRISVKIPKLEVQQKIIDIIEPSELLKKSVDKIKNKLKSLLVSTYEINQNKLISLSKFIKWNYLNYDDQKQYLATNAINELFVDFDKSIELRKDKKPSRANIVPKENSILFSKLIGENKIIPTSNWEQEFVFSTGMYCVNSKDNDHLLGFILSEDFQKQKEIYAGGTTMIAINNYSLIKMKIKDAVNSSDSPCCKLLSKLIYLETKINSLKRLLVELLIKN